MRITRWQQPEHPIRMADDQLNFPGAVVDLEVLHSVTAEAMHVPVWVRIQGSGLQSGIAQSITLQLYVSITVIAATASGLHVDVQALACSRSEMNSDKKSGGNRRHVSLQGHIYLVSRGVADVHAGTLQSPHRV